MQQTDLYTYIYTQMEEEDDEATKIANFTVYTSDQNWFEFAYSSHAFTQVKK